MGLVLKFERITIKCPIICPTAETVLITKMSVKSTNELEELRKRFHALLEPQPKVADASPFLQSGTAAATLTKAQDFFYHIERAVQGVLLGAVVFPNMKSARELIKRDVEKAEVLILPKSRNAMEQSSQQWLAQFFESNKCTFANYLFLRMCTERHISLGLEEDREAAVSLSVSTVVDSFENNVHLCKDAAVVETFLEQLESFGEVEPLMVKAASRIRYLYQLGPRAKDGGRILYGGELESCLERIWSKVVTLQAVPGMTARTCSIKLEEDEKELKAVLKQADVKDVIGAMDRLAFYRSSCPAVVEPMVNRLFVSGAIDIEVYIECH